MLKPQTGAAFMEYVVALGGLIAVFVIVGIVLELTAVKVAKRSVDAVRFDVPCRPTPAQPGDPADPFFSGEQCL